MSSAKLQPSGTSSSSLLLPRRLLLLFFFFLQAGVGVAGQTKPNFIGQIGNVMARAGNDAVLTCTVEMLQGYKVGWIHNNSSVITHNPRVGVSHESTRESKVYRLHLKNVTETDQGHYKCQINTDPMISQEGFLQVVDIPRFTVEQEWSFEKKKRKYIEDGDVYMAAIDIPQLTLVPLSLDLDYIEGSDGVVLMWSKEGDDVYFDCHIHDNPQLYKVQWFHNGNELNHNSSAGIMVSNLTLILQRILAPSQQGLYTCSATNIHGTGTSNAVELVIKYPPKLVIPNQLGGVGARLGSTAMLECNIDAYPGGMNYWTTTTTTPTNRRGEIIHSELLFPSFFPVPKYVITKKTEIHKTYMQLEVRDLTKADFNTSYRCVAMSSLGEADGVIKLYELQDSATPRNTPSLPVFFASVFFASVFFIAEEL